MTPCTALRSLPLRWGVGPRSQLGAAQRPSSQRAAGPRDVVPDGKRERSAPGPESPHVKVRGVSGSQTMTKRLANSKAFFLH